MKLQTLKFKQLVLFLFSVEVWSLKSDRIIGDDRNLVSKLHPDKYTHHASLLNIVKRNGKTTSKICGASFVSRRHVVTAAHCLKGEVWHSVQYVVLPRDEIDIKNHIYSKFHKVIEAYVPADWDYTKSLTESFPQEIGVAKLEKELSEREFPSVKPLKLPGKGTNYADVKGIVIGIGLNTLGLDKNNKPDKRFGTNDLKLRFTKYEILNDADAQTLGSLGCNEDFKLCAYPEGDEETFGMLSYGDSGSGFVYEDNILVGVFVTGHEYVEGYATLVYFSSTSYHREIIDKMLNDHVHPDEIEKHIYT